MAKLNALRHITLDRLTLGLDDLLTKRKAALTGFPYGQFVAPEVKSLAAEIAALPAAVKGAPFADDLAALDRTHDGHGAACFYLVEAHLRSPDTTDAQRKALLDARDVLGALDDITASYDAEAQAAKDRQTKLAAVAATLTSFPVTGGKTLYDWANAYVAAGLSIGEKLSDRADTKDRAAARTLRVDAIGVLNEARRQLARWQKTQPSAPATLDADVFAFLDELEAKSADDAAEEKKKAAQTPAGATGPTGPTGATGPGTP